MWILESERNEAPLQCGRTQEFAGGVHLFNGGKELLMPVKPIPDGYRSITPYLLVADAAAQVDFLVRAFDAEVTERMEHEGRVAHAEVRVGDSMLMIGEARGDWKAMPVMIYMYMPDCDAGYRKALTAGAKSIMEPRDMFYGDRNAGVADANGNQWWFASHKEDVSPEELQRRHIEHMKSQK
jgi:uncharacterized glyoxalase superfamily protein PhnB